MSVSQVTRELRCMSAHGFLGLHAYPSDLCTGISERALSEFIEEAMSAECSKDARRLKRCVKAFCGGKKKANK